MLSKRKAILNPQNIRFKDKIYCYKFDTSNLKLKVEKITDIVYKYGLYEKNHITICGRYGFKKTINMW